MACIIKDNFVSAAHATRQPACQPYDEISGVYWCLLCCDAFSVVLSNFYDRAQVAVGGQHAALVTRNGKLYEWGAGVGGRLLAGSEATSPERVPTLWSRRCVFDGLLLGGFQGVRLVGLE